MSLYEVLLIVSVLAISHSLFLVFALMRLSQKLSNRLLAFLLLLLSVRIGACLAELQYEGIQFFGTYLGGVAMALIGPLFYFYQLSFWKPSFKLRSRDYYHLIPSVIAFSALPLAREEIIIFMFLFGLIVMLIYVLAGLIAFHRYSNSEQVNSVKRKWGIYFNSGISAVTVLFIGQLFIFEDYAYLSIVVASAIVSYVLSIWAVKHVKIFLNDPVRKDNQQQQIKELGKKIEEMLKMETIFTDPLITISSFAKLLKKPPYLVSQAINAYFKKSFPEIINELRIKKAEQLLIDQSKQHYSIEAVAYESGFNSLSAFYSVFKKTTQKTPSQYRNHYLKQGFSEK